MPFVKRDSKKEKKILKELIENDPEARKAVEEFKANYEFRKSLVLARKKENLSQKDLSKITGLTQQVISKIETGVSSATLDTLRKYLMGIGYDIKLVKINSSIT